MGTLFFLSGLLPILADPTGGLFVYSINNGWMEEELFVFYIYNGVWCD